MAIDPRDFDDLENFDPGDWGDMQEIDDSFLRQTNVSWFTRLLLRTAVLWGFGRLARELSGHGLELSKKAHTLFAKAERIDISPLQTDLRGFRVVIDRTLALYFIQDGDHFIYDGFELGPVCEGGDVTVFDRETG